jgi:predicted O-linked N-acetylglucosamine transferase (SPINDLY family)
LLLHCHAGSPRDAVQRLFDQRGIASNRLTFVGVLPTEQYFELYRQIDLALDPFPYCGGTTTCDALWMGVPVVSLAGRTAVGRGGLSILSNVGLPELVARDTEQYVQIAAHLAADRPRLADLRATLRQRMQESPLMDAPRFARNVEATYREMWRRWCAEV